MTSFILAGRDKQKRIAYAKDFCKKQQIDVFDITLLEKETSVKQNTQSIGIDDVKAMQKKIFLKPLKSPFKAVIIEDAQLLTTEAQNALLKVLEEPPMHTIILLGTENREALLPTIQSRCQLISLDEEGVKLTTREQNDLSDFVRNLDTMSVGDKLKRAELLAKDKDKAIVWIEKLITVFRNELLEQPETNRFVATIRKLQSLHTMLKTTNVNPRFAIEQTLLNL